MPHASCQIVGKGVGTPSSPSVLCQCTSCRRHKFVDADTGALTVGKRVGRSERKLHLQADNAATSLAAHYNFAQTDSGSRLEDDAGRAALAVPDVTPEEPPIQEPPPPLMSDAILSKLRSIDKTITSSPVENLFPIANLCLVFSNPPTRESKPMAFPAEHTLVLQEAAEANEDFVRHETWLLSAKELVQDMRLVAKLYSGYYNNLNVLQSRIEAELHCILTLKMGQWESQRRNASLISPGVKVVNTGRYFSRRLTSMHTSVLICHLLVAYMNLICGLSLKNCRVIICALRTALLTFSDRLKSEMANNPETVISSLELGPKTQTFICCPDCFAIYPFDPKSRIQCPETCDWKAAPRSNECGASLWTSTKRQLSKPTRLYLYHELTDWIAQLYSRLDIEEILDTDQTSIPLQADDATWDILDSPGLREFLGPEGDPARPFLKRPGTEGRLVFSLNMDGFNPFLNKESGKKVSVGAIYLVCLNLPAAIRNEVENMFLVSIIPGPTQPSKDQINHLLRPLVDDLLVFWLHGFYLTSTAKYPLGRLVRGAVVPLVCDLPATRQMSGFSSHSSDNFCSLCTLKIEDINNFDYTTWEFKTLEDHMRWAVRWRDAPSVKRKEELYKHSGIRWSELLRLPYWDPTQFVVIDSMHAFFLRIFQRHIRDIWGMSVDYEDGDGPCVEISKKDKPLYEEMVNARSVLRNQSEYNLAKLTVGALKELSEAAGLAYSGKKKELVKNLTKYRVERGWFDESGNVLGDTTDNIPFPTPPPGPTKKNVGRRRIDDPPTPNEVEDGLRMLKTAPMNKLASFRKALLKHLCGLMGIEIPEKSDRSKLLNLLEAWRLDNGISSNVNSNQKSGDKGTKVLGCGTLKEIREDMERLGLPSWVAPAPRQPGTTKQGKFTADQWRSFCTINLVFTLTRIWGSEPAGSRKRRMLDNFLHLITAVKLASMRSMTPERIAQYTFHMHCYLSTLRDLYPGTNFSPYQHLALHFQIFLERFGPVHAWRCFSFERYNYMLQNIPTNMKFGDLERTMFKRFCMGQNLRLFFKPHALPAELDDLIAAWERNYRMDIRGTLRGEGFSFDNSFRKLEERQTWEAHKTKLLPSDWYLNLKHWISVNEPGTDIMKLSPYAFHRKQISRLGEIYRTAETSPTDSNIYYSEADGSISAGSVVGIFSHTRVRKGGISTTQTFFIVHQYRTLRQNYIDLDPFRRFPTVCGQIYEDEFFRGATIISSEELLHHFARGRVDIPGIKHPCFLALPLDKA